MSLVSDRERPSGVVQKLVYGVYLTDGSIFRGESLGGFLLTAMYPTEKVTLWVNLLYSMLWFETNGSVARDNNVAETGNRTVGPGPRASTLST